MIDLFRSVLSYQRLITFVVRIYNHVHDIDSTVTVEPPAFLILILKLNYQLCMSYALLAGID